VKKILFILLFPSLLFSQSFNDGPILIEVKLREVNTVFDGTDVGQSSTIASLATPDELSYIIWAKDNLGVFPWTGGVCDTANFNPSYNGGTGTNSKDFDHIFATLPFPTATVPQFLDFKFDAWEDDNDSDPFVVGILNVNINTTGSRFVWDDYICQDSICIPFLGCFCTYSDGDDYRCLADPFKTGIAYRQGPPCQWFSHGFVNGDPGACINTSTDASEPNTDGYYKPKIETFWRYTKGTSFTNAIDLGVLTTGVLSHYNSNECYADYYPYSSGNDVIYSFYVGNPSGVNISLCGANGAQFDSYLYLVKDTTVVSLTSNNNFCSNQSEITTALCDTGIYYVVVDATSASELGTFTLNITEDPNSTFTTSFTTKDVNCNGGFGGSILANLGGGEAPYTYNWFFGSGGFINTTPITNIMEDSIINLSANNYVLQVSDNNNCTLLDTITISEPTAFVLNSTSAPVSCYGYIDGSASVTVSGGLPSYAYSWNTTPVQTSTAAVFIGSGNYWFSVIDANDCKDSIQVSITEPPPVPVQLNANTITLCNGGSTAIIASGANSYTWSPSLWLSSSTGANIITTPNSSISYVVTATDVNGCYNTDTVFVNVVQAIALNLTPSSPEVCQGESILLSVSGATSYSWFPPNGLSSTLGSSVLASPQISTNYQVIGMDNFGCTDTISVTLGVLPKPSISVTQNAIICEGSSVNLFANGSNQFNWYPAIGLNNTIGNVVTAYPTNTINYSLIGINANGCKDTVITTVTVNPNPSLSVFPSVATICDGDSIPAYISGASTYLWSPALGVNNPSSDTVFLSPISATNYTILGIDNFGCTSSISLLTNVNSLPNVSVSSSSPICIGDISILSASGATTYNWQPSMFLSSTTGSSVSAMPNTTTIYAVSGTDVNNCTSTTNTTILVNPLPILSASPPVDTICEGDNISINANGALNYVWSPSLGLNTTQSSSVIANPITTTSYTITGADANGCSDVISATINVNPKPIITLFPAAADICNGASINISAFGANSYFWNPAFGLNTTTNSVVTASPNATTNYTITGTDMNNCINTANFQLNVGINPSVVITPENPIICEGDNISLTASGANQYVWKPATTLSAGVGIMVSANPNMSTTYTLVGTDAIGCVDSISTTISVNPLPTAIINQNTETTICRGDSAVIIVDVSGNPPWNLSYAVNGAFQQQINRATNPILIFADIAGDYTIPTVTDANGCTSVGNRNLTLNVLNRPLANFDFYPQPVNMLSPNITFSNNSIFANSWYWDFGDGFSNIVDYNPLHSYFKEGTYQVSLVVMNGICSDTMQHTLTIDPVYTFYVPDAFTPNNDGMNDVFYPKGESIAEFEMYIYNRWGEEVFFTTDIKEGWSGKVNNEAKIMAGYYSYKIKITDDLGEYHIVKGKVLLN
jgi:gliding motility-associated-like protein